jgi:hypothetical protein
MRPPPPDWGRIEVESRATSTSGEQFDRQGNPTSWGQSDTVRLAGSGAVVYSLQLVRVQCELYSANWQMIGNIGLVQELWDIIDADATQFPIWLECVMGVGQSSVTQLFDLIALIANAAPWYRTQAGGGGITGPLVIKPWVISGGILGRMVDARVGFSLQPVLGAPAFALATAQISPFAAGFAT